MKRKLTAVFLISGFLLSFAAGAAEQINTQPESKFLPVDEAFSLKHKLIGENLSIQWDIADGYYLYKKRLSIKVKDKKLLLTNLPEAKKKQDPYFGEVDVYYHNLEIELPIPDSNAAEITYQGCAEAGLCYPPQKRVITFNSSIQPVEYQSESDKYLNSFSDRSKLYTLFIYFLVGVATAFAGCSYPMFPILSKIIIGQKEVTQLKSFTLSLAYVLPIASVYALIGVLAGNFGSNLANWFQTPLALVLISLTLVVMSLSMFGYFEIQMPSAIQTRLTNISHSRNGGSYLSAAIMGFISAFIVSACVVPPIVAAVSYITKSGDMLLGASAMFCFGIGLGSPLLLLGLSAGWLLPKAGGWMDSVQRIMAIFLLTAAIWIIDRIIPDWLTFILWASLAAFSSIYVFRILPQKAAVSVSVAGIALTLGLLATSFNIGTRKNDNDFVLINTSSELHALLEQNQQMVFVDFYADWCTACKHMEKHIFTDPEVAALMSKFIKVKIDLSQMSKENTALMKEHDIIGPPAYLVFNTEGREIRTLRLVGETTPENFALVLSEALSDTDTKQNESGNTN